MDLTPFVDQLRSDLLAAAQMGGEELRTVAGLLAAAADPAARVMLLDALVAAADELAAATGVAVEVRLRGREVELVAHSADEPPGRLPPPAPTAAEEGVASPARITLRLPESLKARAEAAAAAEGVSVNTWLVRAVAAAVDPAAGATRRAGTGRRLTGWAQS